MQQLNVIKRKNSFIALGFFVLSFSACSKGGDSPAPTPTPPPPPVVVTEPDVVFKVDIGGSEINYSNVFAVVGTSVVINANLNTLPKDGVTIEVSVKKKADNAVVFSSSTASSTTSNPITISGLTPGVLCVATVIITSKSKSSNAMTKTFELASK
jgi:hypothetical protein